MGYNEDEKVQVKKEFLRMMVKMELNPAETRFILGFFEKYLILDKREKAILMKEIKRTKEFEGFTELPISKLSRKLINDMEKGRKKGIELVKKKLLLN